MASVSVRDKILGLCQRDLELDVVDADPDAETILDFTNYLDADLWQNLRECAQHVLNDGRVAPYQLAGRFARVVVAEPGKVSLDKPTIRFSLLTKLVPESDWLVEEIPESALTDPIPGDNSPRTEFGSLRAG